MSQSGKRSGGKKREDGSGAKEEEMGSGNGEKSESGAKSERTSLNGEGSKPGSAGVSVREGSQRLLVLAMKGEWPPVDQVLKALEKSVASGGEDVNTTPLAGIADPVTGMTPLMYAVKDNRTTFIDRMIDLGVDVTARNFDNYNALHIASMHSREDVVKLLLAKKGVDVYVTGGSKHQTAVHMVASRQTGTATSILRALLAAAGKEIRLRTDATLPQNENNMTNGILPLAAEVLTMRRSVVMDPKTRNVADNTQRVSVSASKNGQILLKEGRKAKRTLCRSPEQLHLFPGN